MEVPRHLSWIKRAEEAELTDGAKAASHAGSSTEAPPPHGFFPDVDLHCTKFSRNPNGTQNKSVLVTVCGKYQCLQTKRLSGWRRFVVSVEKCLQIRGQVALATQTAAGVESNLSTAPFESAISQLSSDNLITVSNLLEHLGEDQPRHKMSINYVLM